MYSNSILIYSKTHLQDFFQVFIIKTSERIQKRSSSNLMLFETVSMDCFILLVHGFVNRRCLRTGVVLVRGTVGGAFSNATVCSIGNTRARNTKR